MIDVDLVIVLCTILTLSSLPVLRYGRIPYTCTIMQYTRMYRTIYTLYLYTHTALYIHSAAVQCCICTPLLYIVCTKYGGMPPARQCILLYYTRIIQSYSSIISIGNWIGCVSVNVNVCMSS